MANPIVLPESKIRLDGGPNVYAAALDPIQRKSGLGHLEPDRWYAFFNGGQPEFYGTFEECREWLDDRAVEMQMARRKG